MLGINADIMFKYHSVSYKVTRIGIGNQAIFDVLSVCHQMHNLLLTIASSALEIAN